MMCRTAYVSILQFSKTTPPSSKLPSSKDCYPVLRDTLFKRQSEIKTMLQFTGVYAFMSEIAACHSLTTGKLLTAHNFGSRRVRDL